MGQTGHAELLGELRRRAERVAEAAGVELVELSLRGSGRRRVLRVDIDRAGPAGVGLEDCQRISNDLGEDLEHSELLSSGYVLEVSSPGVDRPIRTPDDIRRNTGRRVVVTTTEPVEGRSEFRGVLKGQDGECLHVADDEGELMIPLVHVLKARQEVVF